MSQTVVTYPIIGAIKELEGLIGTGRGWAAINPVQQHFLDRFYDAGREELPGLSLLEGVLMESIGSKNASDINDFLAERGFDIQLEEFAPDEVGAGAALEVAVRWPNEGERRSLRNPSGQLFPAFRVVGEGISVLRSPQHAHPIARLETQSEVVVFATILNGAPTGFGLVKCVEAIKPGMQLDSRFEGVLLPMVNLDQRVDISWLLGMVYSPYFIKQALQQTILKMNHKGVLMKSAAAASAVLSLPMDLIINQPFLLWIEKDGLSQPLFTGFITEEDWDDPGEIEELEEKEPVEDEEPPIEVPAHRRPCRKCDWLWELLRRLK